MSSGPTASPLPSKMVACWGEPRGGCPPQKVNTYVPAEVPSGIRIPVQAFVAPPSPSRDVSERLTTVGGGDTPPLDPLLPPPLMDPGFIVGKNEICQWEFWI